jgi:hypothetical protein
MKVFLYVLCALTYSSLYSQTQKGQSINGDTIGDNAYTVAMGDMNTMAIGSPGNNPGKVKVFEWLNNNWSLKGNEITGDIATSKLGVAVDMPNSEILGIGIRNNDNSGKVKIYRWNGAAWVQKGLDIVGPNYPDFFGSCISMPDSNTIAISAIQSNINGVYSGNVYIFNWNGTNWVQVGNNIPGNQPNSFAGIISMPNNQTIAIGAPMMVNSGLIGYVRIYDLINNAWIQRGQTILSDVSNNSFGGSISMHSPNTIAISANLSSVNGIQSGQVKIFTWNGTSWIQKGASINGETNYINFGWSVSMLTDDFIAISAPNSDINGIDAGYVKFFKWNNLIWESYGNTLYGEASAPFQSDYFGRCIESGGTNTIAIGALSYGLGQNSGRTQVYNIGPVSSSQIALVSNDTICIGNDLTFELTINGGTPPYNVTINNGTNTLIFQGNENFQVNLSPTLSGSLSIQNIVDSNGDLFIPGINQINYTVLAPVDSIINQGLSSFCSGNYTTLVAYNSSISNSYQWYKNNMPISGANTGILITNPSSSSGNYFLQSTIGNCTITSNSITINTFNISTTINTSICPGSSYTFNGVNYTSGGTYSQSFQTQNGCDSIVYINVNILPNDFNPSLTSNQQLFTSPPFAVQYSNTTANIGNYNFTWYWGDGTSTTSNNPTVFHEYLTNGLFTVTLEATNTTTGCTDETTYTDYIYTTGGVSCTHSATINQSGPINACAGQPVILTCNSDPSFTYQWRKNGVYIPGNNNDTLIVTQSGSYSVIISVNGCPVASTSVSVNFQSITQPTITSSGTIQPCIGGSVNLTASSGYSSYLWSNGATTQTITVNTSGNYTVQGTGSNGCTSTSNPYTINASFLPSQNICVVGVDSLTNNIRVVWEEPQTTAIDSFYIYKESNVSNVYTQVGSRAYDSLSVWIDPVSNPAVQSYRYKITALDTCGVETPLSDFHKTIHLTINQGVGGAWNLIWSHYEGINFGSYNIYRGTSSSNMTLLTTIQSNLNSYTDLAPPSGIVYYQIEIVNPNNCTPTKSTNYGSSKSNIATNELNEYLAINFNPIKLYPNPNNGEFTLLIPNDWEGQIINIVSLDGKIHQTFKAMDSMQEIHMNHLASGSYWLRVGTNNPIPFIKN